MVLNRGWRSLSISVLEFVISWWALILFVDRQPEVTHVLEFTDNSGAEWSARRETPSAEFIQRVTACRSEGLRKCGVFVRACRVFSKGNSWADHLSRQRLSPVLAEAAALGLTVVHLQCPRHCVTSVLADCVACVSRRPWAAQ